MSTRSTRVLWVQKSGWRGRREFFATRKEADEKRAMLRRVKHTCPAPERVDVPITAAALAEFINNEIKQ